MATWGNGQRGDIEQPPRREPLSRSAIKRVAAQQGQFGRELWRALAWEAEDRRCPVASRVLRGLDCVLVAGHDGEHVASKDGVRWLGGRQ